MKKIFSTLLAVGMAAGLAAPAFASGDLSAYAGSYTAVPVDALSSIIVAEDHTGLSPYPNRNDFEEVRQEEFVGMEVQIYADNTFDVRLRTDGGEYVINYVQHPLYGHEVASINGVAHQNDPAWLFNAGLSAWNGELSYNAAGAVASNGTDTIQLEFSSSFKLTPVQTAPAPTTTELGLDGVYKPMDDHHWTIGNYIYPDDTFADIQAEIKNNRIVVSCTKDGTPYELTGNFVYDPDWSSVFETDGYFAVEDFGGELFISTKFDRCEAFIGGWGIENHPIFRPDIELFCDKVTAGEIPAEPSIAPGRYGGTGTADVNVVFGNFPIATLPLINATITENDLTLSFRARGLDYQFNAPRISVETDGTANYRKEEADRTWEVSITPDGALTGNVTYTGGRGSMDFRMALTAK